MAQLLYGLAALACPVGMGVMMWMMVRRPRSAAPTGTAGRTSQSLTAEEREAELVRLQAELDQLRAAQPRPESLPDRIRR